MTSSLAPKDNDWALIKKLAPYAQRQKWLLLISLMLLVPVAISGAVQPLIIGQAISELKNEPSWAFLRDFGQTEALKILTGLLLATIVVRFLFLSVQGYLVQKIGQEVTAGVRMDLFSHVTALSSKFFDRTPVGKLITRITSDVEALGDVFATGAIGIFSDIISILAIIVTMFWLQWQLATLLILMLIPVTGVIIYFQNQYREANYVAREELSNLNSKLQENVTGINIVQLFRREKFNAEMFRKVNQDHLEAVNKTIFHDSAVSATLEWISLVAIAGILATGGLLVLKQEMNFGTLSAFILYSERLFNPLRQFADKFTMFQSGFTAIERINELMAEKIEIADRENLQQISTNNSLSGAQNHLGEIIFENVWFGYKPDEFVIKDLSFKIKAGEKIALVGPTGAGKSSIIRLLCRLYEPSKGRILVDGVDIRDLSQADLRSHIGVILQESFLFAGDVKRNITLGEDYSLEEIKRAAEITNVADFIERLPQDYDTVLRERGTNLSGGQKQLLAFARVAIRDPKILVLDEATSSLDVKTEALIQTALDRLLVNRTAIIIAHRLSTIRNVDRIFVLKYGALVEEGNHDQLLAQNGLYASLHKLQTLGT
jgi:ATP-binding cassette subfamily B protein